MVCSLGSWDPPLRGSSLCRRTVLAYPSVLYLSRTAAAQAGWLQQTDPFSKSFKEALEASDLQVWRGRIAISSNLFATCPGSTPDSGVVSGGSLEQGHKPEAGQCCSLEQSWYQKASGWTVHYYSENR